ncbi:MAG TPA: PAS domain S-box protein [Gemmatimonadales bacterium]|nr:PAS domain S-box protein [Gemmatimonadales bacterium]
MPQHQTSPGERPLRVLLVEDDPADAMRIRELLARVDSARYEVDSAPTHEGAIAALRLGKHDVCLVDDRLGRRSGIELVAEARSAGSWTPTILLTRPRDDGVGDTALRLGAADVLSTDELQPRLLARSIRYAIERSRVETALRESKACFQSAFESSLVGMSLTGLDGHYLRANEALGRFLGYPAAELRRLSIGQVSHPDDLEHELNLARELVAGERQNYQMEKRFIHRDGRVLWGVLSVSLVHDADQRPLYFVSQIQDITHRRETEATLAEAERRFRAIFDNSFELSGLLARDGTVIEINQATLKFLHVERQQVIGRRLWELPVWGDDALREQLRGWVEEAVGGRFVRSEIVLQLGGQPAVLDFSIKPVVDEAGRVTMLIPEARDISELKQLEGRLRQVQRLEAIGQLAGGVAHDFNNHLTAILADCELLRQELDTTPAIAALEQIHATVQGAAALVAQLLIFSRKQVLQPKIFDLNETIVGLEGMLRRLIGEHIQISFELVSVPLRICADPVQLQQVVLNLAVNARDAMPNGGLLTIRTGMRMLSDAEASAFDLPRAGPYVALEVADRGCGMDSATLTRIFEPFFTTKEPGKGTGLGLATAYGIVKQSSGAITVKSTPHAGTTFTIFFPFERRRAPRSPEQQGVALTQQMRGTETLLIVEDDPGIRRSVEALLARHGYTVIMASNPATALDALRNPDCNPHLLVTDVVLPGMSGPELAVAALALRPTLNVLFMSGYTSKEVFRDELAIGTGFLNKPFTLQEFLQKVRGALDERPAGGPDIA